MNDISEQASKTIKNLETYQKRWHIFKAVLLTIGMAIIVIVQFYTYHKIFHNSDSNHQLICSISKQAQVNNAIIMEDCK